MAKGTWTILYPQKGPPWLGPFFALYSFPFYCFFSFFLFQHNVIYAKYVYICFAKTLLIYTSIYESITVVPLHTGYVPCSDLCHNMNYSQA
jgi:hypothetical protein